MFPYGVRIGVLSLVLPVGLAAAQTVRLNPPFELDGVVGDVRDLRVHPAGGEVVFRADVRNEDALELYRVPLDGSRRPLQVVAMAAGRSVWRYEFTPDGQWLVWTGEKHDADVGLFVHRVGVAGSVRLSPETQGDVTWFEIVGALVVYATSPATPASAAQDLYSVPLDGSAAPVRLTPATTGTLPRIQVSAAADRVVFSRRDLSGVYTLFSSPLDGSAPALVLDTPIDGTAPSAVAIQLAADGMRVVYPARVSGDLRLRSVPLDGSSAPVELAGAIGHLDGYFIAPDSSRLVYGANELNPNKFEVYSVPIAGGASLRISDALTATQQLSLEAVHGARAYYTRTGGGTTPRLFSVPIAGGVPALQLATFGDAFGPIRFTPDGTRAVYQTGEDGFLFFAQELYSVPLDGSAPAVELATSSLDFELSPDSTRVVFSRNFDDGGVLVARLDGSAPALMVVPGGSSPEDLAFAFTPDSAGVVVAIDAASDGVHELYRAHVSGAGLVKLSDALARGTFADVNGFEGDESGARVAFQADANVDGTYELFTVASDGSPAAVPLSGTGRVGQVELTPDGARAVYAFDSDLWSAPLDGSGTPLQLNPPVAAGRGASYFHLTSDGSRAVYLVNGGSAPWELWSAPVDGGTAVLLGLKPEADFLPMPDSLHALYKAHDAGLAMYRLQRVALDGSSTTELAQAVIRNFLPSPDGARVVYSTYSSQPTGLFVVPADGSAPPTTLEPLLQVPPELGPSALRVTADSSEAVYVARQPASLPQELYAAPLDASASPRKLSHALGFVTGVQAFFLDPTGARVVYVVNDFAQPEFDLFSVPLDGSAAPVALNAPFALNRGITAFTTNQWPVAITPDGARVLYVADQDTDEVFELYVVPIDGSAAPSKLNRPLTSGGDLTLFRMPLALTPDSTRAVYCADQDVDGVSELYLAALDGSSVMKLNVPLTEPGCPAIFGLTGDGERLLYMATQRPDVTELFSLALPEIPQQRHVRPR